MHTAALDHAEPVSYASHQEHPEHWSDQALLRTLSLNGSEWAIEQLYNRYKHYSYALAYRILGDSSLAEDVVQDAFFALWQKAFSYQQELGSVKTWLQAIVRNRALDKVRSSTYREYQFAHLLEMDEHDVPSIDAEMWEQVWGGEQSVFIRKALAQLPPEQRQVIALNYFSGYTHMEIARQLQLPIGTVKGRIRLGLRKIKLLLQADGIDASA